MVRSAVQPPMKAAGLPPAPSAEQSGGGGAATWVDVAPLLTCVCSAMQPGQLVQADSFSLFESVSAVEIGGHVRIWPLISKVWHCKGSHWHRVLRLLNRCSVML